MRRCIIGPCRQGFPEELRQAVEEFNDGRWFECHETLEELWVGSTGELRDFYQGLLQIAVALYHHRNGNFKGAMGLLQKGSACLSRVSAVCQRVDVKGLLTEASAMERALAVLGEERMGELSPHLVPRVKTVDPA